MLNALRCLPALCLLLAPCGCRRGTTPPPRAASPGVTFVAVGDILLDRGVAKQIERHGTAYPFARVAGILSAADIAFGNLECPLSARGTKVVKPFCFQARPSAAECLVKGGLDLLSVANNHTMDCGRTGLVETMDTLRGKDLHWCGAGRTRAEAEAATVLAVRGLRIAFVGFCDFLPEGTFLRDDRPTIAFASEPAIRAAVTAARRQADVVVVSCHWGIEYDSRPSPRQLSLARAAVASGADLVLGHHPHVLQGLEVVRAPAAHARRPALIAYSLGNFVFDRRTERAAESAVLRCTLDKAGLAGAEVIPVRLEDTRPRPAIASEARAILERLTLLSRERNTLLSGSRVLIPPPAPGGPLPEDGTVAAAAPPR